MKALFDRSTTPEATPTTDLETESDSPTSTISMLSMDNMRRNLGNAWNSLAYGKWRRKGDILEDAHSQIWLLGRWYKPQSHGSSYEDDCPLFFHDYVSRIWLTYRRDFAPLLPTAKTTDCGWGCMIRSSQMMIAQALTVLMLGRAFRSTEFTAARLKTIITLFEDCPEADLGLHRLMRLAVQQTDESAIGKWYAPSRAMALLRDAINNSNNELLESLRVYLVADNMIVVDEIEQLSLGWTKAVIIVVCVRLGTKKVNACYKHHVKSVLSMEYSLGAIGGRPRHSVYFIGFHGETVFHLDPHVSQKYIPLTTATDPKIWSSFHCHKPTRMKLDDMDPSCAFGFLIQSKADFDRLVRHLVDGGIIEHANEYHPKLPTDCALFSVVNERISPAFVLSDDATSDVDEADSLHGFEVV